MAEMNTRLVRTLSLAARHGVPLVVRLAATSGGTLTLRDVMVAEVALDHAVVRSRGEGKRVVVRFDSLRAVERLDGRPFNPKPRERDARAELAERADAHVDEGGLE